MSSPSRIEHVFYNAHSKVSHYVLRHTSHRLRSLVEHAVLGLAVCGFCVVILSHRTFVHREDIASIVRDYNHDYDDAYDADYYDYGDGRHACSYNRAEEEGIERRAVTTDGSIIGVGGLWILRRDIKSSTFVHREDIASIARDYSNDDYDDAYDVNGYYYGDGRHACSYNRAEEEEGIGRRAVTTDGSIIGECRGVSIYSIMVQLVRVGYAYMVSSSSSSSSKQQYISSAQNGTPSSSSWTTGKKIPGSCLKSITGFREDADVNHILLRYEDEENQRRRSSSSSDNDGDDSSSSSSNNSMQSNSQAFTIRRGLHDYETIVSGASILLNNNNRNNSTQQQQQRQLHSCIIGRTRQRRRQQKRKSPFFGFRKDASLHHEEEECSPEVASFLAQHGYFINDYAESFDSQHQQQHQQQQQQMHSTTTTPPQDQQFSSIIYSYSHSQGLLRLAPSLQHAHNLSTQFVIVDTTDPACFGEPFAQSIIFKLVGPDTVILNWILGLQRHDPPPFAQSIIFKLVGPDTVILNWILGLQRHDPPAAAAAVVVPTTTTTVTKMTTSTTPTQTRKRSYSRRKPPRFVHHWKTKKELDLHGFDRDHYAFSSYSKNNDYEGSSSSSIHGYETIHPSSNRHQTQSPTSSSTSSSSSSIPPITSTIHQIITHIKKHPLYRFLKFLLFKFLVLLSTLLVFFLTTSLVSFTFEESQDRMLEFTLQLQIRVRSRLPLGGLILGHVLENLVFVPILVGMIFFLIEFYGDKFLAFMVLSMVWVCEVFSAISIRSAQGMHFFPRVFFLYFTLFHVYFFSCPIGFTYASLASTILFLFHTMLFFWNRYELPALHAGLITPQSPRMMMSLGVADTGGRENTSEGVMVNGNMIISPPRIRPSVVQGQIPPMPRVSNSSPDNDDDRSASSTVPTAPLSSIMDFTPQSEQQNLLPQSYSGPMRSYIAAASTSLQSIRSLASIQSSSSLVAAEGRTTSPNFIFQGAYSFHDSEGVDNDGEEDSFIARVMSSQ
eukprot:CAMPEP_0183748370 /NCGR_PEP_ID=MMETSP0737-20130205/67730_1 /TAXON_ID=385413 /ORGANISM="Thalassiosira miniscula, Strain CCMP1093" /LENGTH=1003 /DNA_ID=CAMNT_0025984093 /DNA_START=618 /DNA_END=3630 /DNA_ORIENTATION=-